jgi:tetratricopeptide (TPR) repeat protein
VRSSAPRLFFIVLAVGIALNAPAQTQEEDWQVLAERARELGSAGKTGEAIEVFARVLAMAENELPRDDPTLALLLRTQAIHYENHGQLDPAVRLVQRAMGILERHRDPKDIAAAADHLGNLYRKLDRFGEAEPLMRRAIDVSEKGGDPNEVADRMNDLAFLYLSNRRQADAISMFKREIEFRETALPNELAALALRLSSLGSIYENQGRHTEAEAYLIRSVQMVPAFTPATAFALNNLAKYYSNHDRFAEAEPLFKRAIEVGEKALQARDPKNSEDLATSLRDLAQLYQRQGRSNEAEPLFERALKLREEKMMAPGPIAPRN